MAEDTPSGGSPPSGPSKGPSKESIDIAIRLSQALDDVLIKNRAINSEFEKLHKNLSAIASTGPKGLKKTTNSMELAGATLEGLSKKAKSFGKNFVSVLTTISRQISMATNAFSFFGRTFIGIGRSFLSFPIALFGTIANKAAELLNGSTALRQAYENVRKTFGDLSKAESKSVLTAFKELRSSAHSLGGSTLSLSRIYGYGPDGLAKALEELTETAHAMGPIFGLLRRAFETSADDLLIYQKGLGLSAEQMKAFGSISIATGRPLNDLLKETGNLALQMGDKFGISSKELGRDLGYMTQNMGKFGSMTRTQMATSAVFTRKLGLEIKELEGLISKFDDFESAAEGASRLAQAFGMNVDALSMMKEQDPAKRLDMLRKSFAATGKSIENMSRQERALLAETSGLDENTVALALSTKNMGLSYEQVQKQAEDSNKKQKSQAEIMQGLSENIERFIESIQHSGSFLTQFLNGFMRGISRSKVFREAMHDMATALRAVYQFGIKVGEVFVTAFPGVEGMIRSIGNFVKLITAASKTGGGAISGFFEAFSTAEGAKKKVGELFDMLMGVGVQAGGPLSEFNKEYNKFLNSIANGISAIIPRIADELVKAIDETINSLDAAFSAFGDEAKSKAISPGARILFSLFEGITKVVPKLIELVGAVLLKLFTNEKTRGYMITGALGLFAFIAGPTVLSFATTLLGGLFSAVISAALTAAATGGTVAAGGTGLLATLGAALTNPVGWALIAAGIMTALGFALSAALKTVGKDRYSEFMSYLFGGGEDIKRYFEVQYVFLIDQLNIFTSGIQNFFGGIKDAAVGFMKIFVGIFNMDPKIFLEGIAESVLGLMRIVVGGLEVLAANIPGSGWLFRKLKEAAGLTPEEGKEISKGNAVALEEAAVTPSPAINPPSVEKGFADMFSIPKDSSLVGQSKSVIAVGEESRNLKKAAQALSDVELQENLFNAQAGINALDGFYAKLSTSSFFANYEEIGNKFSGITTALTEVSSGNFGTVAKEAAKDIVKMNDALASLDPVKMDATLDRLGENLSFKNEVLNIERKPVVVNIDLKLSIKAEEFVKDYEKVKSNMILRGERITGNA